MPFDGVKRVAPISDAMRAYFQGGRMWQKGDLGFTGGPRCFIGAWLSAKKRGYPHMSMAEQQPLLDAIRRAGFGKWMLAFQWNDAPERTYADIERVLDALAEIEAEQNVTT